MEQLFSPMSDIKPVFFEKDNASMVLLSKDEYDKMVMECENAVTYRILQQAKLDKANGVTKYRKWDDVYNETKAKHIMYGGRDIKKHL